MFYPTPKPPNHTCLSKLWISIIFVFIQIVQDTRKTLGKTYTESPVFRWDIFVLATLFLTSFPIGYRDIKYVTLLLGIHMLNIRRPRSSEPLMLSTYSSFWMDLPPMYPSELSKFYGDAAKIFSSLFCFPITPGLIREVCRRSFFFFLNITILRAIRSSVVRGSNWQSDSGDVGSSQCWMNENIHIQFLRTEGDHNHRARMVTAQRWPCFPSPSPPRRRTGRRPSVPGFSSFTPFKSGGSLGLGGTSLVPAYSSIPSTSVRWYLMNNLDKEAEELPLQGTQSPRLLHLGSWSQRSKRGLSWVKFSGI